ncbi:MAG: restriction endonuclease subunit S [Acidobacteria bacterium]|nr:restriction endonuclease subunit S [Acidobacteriota bacterium]
MKWSVVPIGKVCLETGQRDPGSKPDTPFRYVDLSTIDRESKKIVSAAEIKGIHAPSRARKEIRTGDVLVSTVRPNLNAVTIVPEDLDGEIASTGLCVLRADRNHVHPRFLFYRVRCDDFVQFLVDRVTGANYPAVSDRVVKAAPLPLPPLDEQERIVRILDEAEELRKLRTQADRRTGDLTSAIFHDMFGDIVRKTPHPVQLLAEVAEVVSGVAKGRRFNGQTPVTVPYIRVANVQAGYLDLTEIKTIQALASEVKELTLKKGDLLLTEGGDFDKLGRGAIWEREIPSCIHQNHIFRVRVDQSKLLPIYFDKFLQTSTARKYFLGCAKRTTNLASINMTQLRGLPVPIPPLSLQRQFAARVAEIRAMQVQQAASRRRLDDLFQSLLHQAFRG